MSDENNPEKTGGNCLLEAYCWNATRKAGDAINVARFNQPEQGYAISGFVND